MNPAKSNIGKSTLILAAFFNVFLSVCSYNAAAAGPVASPAVTAFTYQVIQSYPHDPDAFTQGLVIDRGVLYEGTGQFGRSSLRRVDMLTGKTTKIHSLPGSIFGEGVTVFQDRIIQLTWKSNIIFIYDKHSFEQLDAIAYPYEGWGITHDGRNLITSDGTATIRFLDPETFAKVREIKVTDGKGPVANLNELEYVKGLIYANIWHSSRIAMIDPKYGRVTGWLDLTGVLEKNTPGRRNPAGVLNGIAYDPLKDALYVTGKLWPRLFEIKPVLLEEE